jgi:hypothetical protein
VTDSEQNRIRSSAVLAFLSFSLATCIFTSESFASGNIKSNGAVSGGGGGTLPSNPVTISQINEIVEKALPEMRLVAREMSRRVFRGTETALETKLFSGPVTIIDLLEDTGYELRTDKPCFDRFGNEVDASIFANKPNNICISSFRIAPKLIEERARVETLALIFHEISHKLGTSEAEATEFQKEVAYLLSQADPSELSFPQSSMISSIPHSVSRALFSLAIHIEQGSTNTVLEVMTSELSQRAFEFAKATNPKNPYSYYSRRQDEYVEWLKIRLHVVKTTLFARVDKDPEYWEKQLNEIFGAGGTVTTYGSYLRAESPTSYRGNDFENNILTRPQTDQDLIEELRSLGAAFVDEGEYLHPFGSMAGLALLKHPSDSPTAKRSPFALFLGRYKVSDVKCTAQNYSQPETRIPLEIELLLSSTGNHNQVELKKSWASMWLTDILQDNGHTSLGGAVMQTDGSDLPGAKMAEATAVFGTPWTERWMVQKTRIEERPEGLFYVDTYQNEERTWRGPIDSSYRCEAKLSEM